MLEAPTSVTATIALPSEAHCHPSVTSDRRPSRASVARFQAAMPPNHPLSWLRGTYDEVRNKKGNNNMKLELSAAGFAVFSAIA